MSLPPQSAPIASIRNSHPLIAELCQAALDAHRGLLENLLRELDRAADPLQSELAARLRLDRAPLQRRYLREIGRRFEPLAQAGGGSADRELQRYTRPPSEVFEEQITLDALARRLRAAHAAPLTRIEQRLRGLPVAATAHSPAGAIEAFRIALEALDIELPQRRLLFALYEPAAEPALSGLCERALSILDRAAVEAPTESGDQALGLPAALELAVDEASLQALRERAGGTPAADAQLARALLAIIEDAGDGPQRRPVLQHLVLLGRLCAALTQPLSAAARSDIGKLRFTLIKIVLADSAFLLTTGHPLRRLLREACERQDERRRRQVCAQIEQIALSAGFVHDSLPQLATLDAQQIEACLEQLHPPDEIRDDARLAEARRGVAQALERATLMHARPQGLRLFLRAGWGPLLTQRLLKHGQPSAPWQDALDQLDHLLTAISSSATRVRDFESLLAAAAAELFEAGMRSDRCDRLQQALREAFYELRMEAAAADSPPAAQNPLPGNGVLDLPGDEPDLQLLPVDG
jgi:hypothetical protein